jgi:glutathione peroxidase
MGPVRTLALLALALAVAGIAAGCAADEDAPAAAAGTAETAAPAGGRGPSVLRTPIRLLDGSTLRPAALRGRVVLAVNTASRCGYTPQFEGLEALHRAKRADGLTVVGFPSDDFRQELGSGEEIAAFCELNYGVSFPMAEEGPVTGARAQPLFARIAARPGPAGEEPAWNFTKYLLDREGRLVARFGSSVEPDDPSLVAAVDRLLSEGV